MQFLQFAGILYYWRTLLNMFLLVPSLLLECVCHPIFMLVRLSLTLYTSEELLIGLLLRPFIIDWRSHNMFLSVPLVSLDCVCHLISLCKSSPETLLVLYSDLLWSWRFNMCMYITVCPLYLYEVLYCNVCTLCTACSGVVCGNSIVICCIVSPPWPPQGPSGTYQHS